MTLLLGLIFLKVSLHVLDSFLVELALDLSGSLEVVIVQHELIKVSDSFTKVLNRDMAVFVEV